MNKKGFTLIEMLVVIAIIAVLVSIIIPTVTSATDKAAAATNAANLRSWKASVTTSYLSGETKVAEDGTITLASNLGTAPESVKCGKVEKGVAPTVAWNSTTKEFDVTYGTNTITQFAAVADGTAEASSLAEAKKSTGTTTNP